MTTSRRELLRNSALTGAAIATGGFLSGLPATRAGAARPGGGYGGLVADPAGIVDLPTGFRYTVLQQGGDNVTDNVASTYDDGQKLAGDADGAASFAIGGGRTVIVTNHELRESGELTGTGELWPFAFNRTGGSEFAGANFSPDGKSMFVNIQDPSMTLAITGPWRSVRKGL